jgi:hypothetical protein
MISQPPRDKEGDLVIRGFEEERKTIDLTIKAEGIIASAFYLFSLNPLEQAVRLLIFRMRSF